MDAILARLGQEAVPRPPALMEPALINLRTALTHMPEATPGQVDVNLTAWYTMLQREDGPAATAAGYTALCNELRSKGNPQSTGPQFLVVNGGQGKIKLLSCLFERPASIPNMPAESAFTTAPYIAIVDNKATQEGDWTYVPTTAAALFTQRTDKLVSWGSIKEPARNDRGAAYAKPRGKDEQEYNHFPVLPLYGKTICTQMVDLLYPAAAEGAQEATIKQVAYLLKGYVDSIPTEATKLLARRSLAGLVTNTTAGNQAGSIELHPDATNNQEAKAAIQAWTATLISKTINPRNPVTWDEQSLEQSQGNKSSLPPETVGGQDRGNRGSKGTSPPNFDGDRDRGTNGNDLVTIQEDEYAKAQFDSIFLTSGINHNRNQGPPHKQPRLSTDTGFNSLSNFRQRQFLSIAKVNCATYLPSQLKELLEVDKADRLAWFEANHRPRLCAKAPEAFSDFEYTSDCLDQLCEGNLTASTKLKWWESTVGHQLYRNKEDVHQLNLLHRTRGDPRLQLQITPAQLGSLNSKAPVPVTTLSELLAFLQRVWHFTTFYFPMCATGDLARRIYQALLTQRRVLERDAAWCALKCGEIISKVDESGNQEFKHVVPLEDFLNGHAHDSYYQPPLAEHTIQQCLSPAPTVAQGYLPPAPTPPPPPTQPQLGPGGAGWGGGGVGAQGGGSLGPQWGLG